MYVSLPTPVSIELGSAQEQVTCSGDAAEFLGIPTAAQLNVKVRGLTAPVPFPSFSSHWNHWTRK